MDDIGRDELAELFRVHTELCKLAIDFTLDPEHLLELGQEIVPVLQKAAEIVRRWSEQCERELAKGEGE